MAQSGIQSENLDENETAVKNDVQNWLMNTPNSLKVEGGIQRFASAILFNDPKSVKLAQPEQNLPSWFLEGYKRYMSMSDA